MEKTIVVKADGREYSLEPETDLRCDEGHLNLDMARHAALACWWGCLAARAISLRDRAEQAVKDAKSEVDVATRQQAEERGQKMTEERVKNLVETHARVVKTKTDYLSASEQADLAIAIREAFQHRRDMLVGLGANLRASIVADPAIRHFVGNKTS